MTKERDKEIIAWAIIDEETCLILEEDINKHAPLLIFDTRKGAKANLDFIHEKIVKVKIIPYD